MNTQNVYWASMVYWKYELLCLESIFRKNIVVSRVIKIFIAIVSSSAIATWAIWDKYSMLWGAIIAISQIAMMVYEYTPYQTRISQLSQLITKASMLYQEIEKSWFDVANGNLEEAEIYELRCKYAKVWAEMQNSLFDSDCTNISKQRANKMSEETDLYFKNLYG